MWFCQDLFRSCAMMRTRLERYCSPKHRGWFTKAVTKVPISAPSYGRPPLFPPHRQPHGVIRANSFRGFVRSPGWRAARGGGKIWDVFFKGMEGTTRVQLIRCVSLYALCIARGREYLQTRPDTVRGGSLFVPTRYMPSCQAHRGTPVEEPFRRSG